MIDAPKKLEEISDLFVPIRNRMGTGVNFENVKTLKYEPKKDEYSILTVNPGLDLAFGWFPEENYQLFLTPVDRWERIYKTLEGEKFYRSFFYPTFHPWAYYGFFKPTLGDIFSQLPDLLWQKYSDELIYVTTQPSSPDIEHLLVPYGLQNSVHLGKTHVLLPCNEKGDVYS